MIILNKVLKHIFYIEEIVVNMLGAHVNKRKKHPLKKIYYYTFTFRYSISNNEDNSKHSYLRIHILYQSQKHLN